MRAGGDEKWGRPYTPSQSLSSPLNIKGQKGCRCLPTAASLSLLLLPLSFPLLSVPPPPAFPLPVDFIRYSPSLSPFSFPSSVLSSLFPSLLSFALLSSRALPFSLPFSISSLWPSPRSGQAQRPLLLPGPKGHGVGVRGRRRRCARAGIRNEAMRRSEEIGHRGAEITKRASTKVAVTDIARALYWIFRSAPGHAGGGGGVVSKDVSSLRVMGGGALGGEGR